MADSIVRISCSKGRVGVLSAPKRRSFSRSACHALVTISDTIVIVSDKGKVRPRAGGLFGIYDVQKVPVFAFVGGLSHSNHRPVSLVTRLRRILRVSTCPVG